MARDRGLHGSVRYQNAGRRTGLGDSQGGAGKHFNSVIDAGVNFKFGYEERVAQAIKQARKDEEKV